MALDYSPKKQVNKNRPRKRPVKLLLLLIMGSIVSLYGLGVATGWLIFKYVPQKTLTSQAGSSRQVGSEEQSPPSPAQNPAKNSIAAPGKDPDLTFYYTLPKGEKGVIGSGINKLPPQTTSKNTPPTTDSRLQHQPQLPEKVAVVTTAAAKEKAEKIAETANSTPETAKAVKGTYTVQVAAYNKKSDAQGLKAKLQKIGIASRIEEYTVPGKGIWYRVRSGKNLDKETAIKIAAKLGASAILVAE